MGLVYHEAIGYREELSIGEIKRREKAGSERGERERGRERQRERGRKLETDRKIEHKRKKEKERKGGKEKQ